jgi:hypothetical protein
MNAFAKVWRSGGSKAISTGKLNTFQREIAIIIKSHLILTGPLTRSTKDFKVAALLYSVVCNLSKFYNCPFC